MPRKTSSNLPVLSNMGAIIIFFGIFLLCFIWVSLFYKIQSERQLERDHMVKETANLTQAFEELTVRVIKSADEAVIFLIYQYQKEGRGINIPRYISEGRFSGLPFVQLGIIDENGVLTATSKVPYTPIKLGDREHFLVHKLADNGKLFISKPVLGRVSRKWSLQMTRRINKPDGSFGGVAVVSLDPFYFTQFYKRIDLGKRSVVTLVGRDNIIRARLSDQKASIGQTVNSVLTHQLAISAAGHYIEKSPVDGIRRLYNYRALRDYPLVVAVGVDQAYWLRALHQRINGYFLYMSLLTLVILCFILVLLHIAARQRLTEAALKQAHDNLENQVKWRTQELFAANNELQNINHDLEQKIAERDQAEEALRQKKKALQMSQQILSMAAELAHLGPWEFDPEANLFEFGDEFYAIYGTNVQQEGQFMPPETYCREFVYPEDLPSVMEAVKNYASPAHLEHRIIRRDGEVRTIIMRRKIKRDAAGKITGYYGANQDITEIVQARKALRQQDEIIRRMAYTDSLTGLANRAMLNEWLAKEMEHAHRDNSAGAVLFIDLDDLKTVNDTYGHTCGDKIIIEAAARIVAAVGHEVFVARIGGDEFIAVLPGKSDRRQIVDISKRVSESLGQKQEILGTHFQMSASIGIATYPADGDTAEEVIKNADNAMYAAKRGGKNSWCFYTADMQAEVYENMRMTNSLRHALERHEFSLHYQPQILASSGEVSGFEALLRWNSHEYGSVPPAQFIPLAEKTGLILPIGQWVLREACRFAKRLTEQGLDDIFVGVNISSKQLATDNFVAVVCSALDEAGIAPHLLKLEITESIFMSSMEDARRKFTELRRLGVGLSLDDFGIGYSSLTYLLNLPVEMLKIDKSFIDIIPSNPNGAKIIGTIINMAHVLNMKVTAEGVETEQQLAYLANGKCDYIQGYVYSRPLPETEALAFLNAKMNRVDSVESVSPF